MECGTKRREYIGIGALSYFASLEGIFNIFLYFYFLDSVMGIGENI